jgi:hypothetical protein
VLSQALSVNLLAGANLVKTDFFKIDAAALLGFREETADCADSYLGYQCYANTAPNLTYNANLGAVINLSIDRYLLGVRATAESTQVSLGMRF